MGSARGQTLKDTTASVVRVGHARGFVVNFVDKVGGDLEIRSRIIVTAADVLQHAMESNDAWFSLLSGGQNKDLVGPFGGKASFSAECLFINPIEDVALLWRPYLQSDEDTSQEDFLEFIQEVPPLEFASGEPSSTWGLDLSNEWREMPEARISMQYGFYNSINTGDDQNAPMGVCKPGTSGGPILDGDGRIVALVGSGGGVQPRLPHTLPRWFAEGVITD